MVVIKKLMSCAASIPTAYLASSSRKRSFGMSVSVTSKNSAKSANSWCCTASILSDSCPDGVVSIHKVAGYDDGNSPFREGLDLTESPGWMEYLERSENRMNDEGGAGAYDTLRCDMILSPATSKNTTLWRNWGLEFHLKRLQNSYRSLIRQNRSSSSVVNQDEAIQAAVAESHLVFGGLLAEAERSCLLHNVEQPVPYDDVDVTIQLVRMTFLWSPSLTDASSKAIVRGHACSSGSAMKVHCPVKPIVVTVAAVGHHHHNNDRSSNDSDCDIEVDESLPTRYLDPQNKVQSWTRLRKKMENPTYKPPGVSEVLMLRPRSSDLEVLEGLSSNFFVIYKDGTIRTAQDGVLFGYVRHLVLESLEACGLVLDPKPVLLHEAKSLWKEAFITSSSRLVIPISQILIHSDNTIDFEEYWSDQYFKEGAAITEKPKWQELLDEIMRKGGYPE